MAAAKWQPGTLYPPGSIVQPSTTPPAGIVTLNNPGFETGNLTGWAADAGSNAVVSGAHRRSGSYGVEFSGTAGQVKLMQQASQPVAPGVSVTAGCWAHQGPASKGNNAAAVAIQFYDGVTPLGLVITGNVVDDSDGGFKQSTVTSVTPAGADGFRIGVLVNRTASGWNAVDDFTCSTNASSDGLLFRAVQPSAGYSGVGEPTWPTVSGVQVVDNEVTWEAYYGSRITYQAEAILVSGPTEPTWPLTAGATVLDGTIKWELAPLSISDVNCPHTRVWLVAKYKIFAGDGDIVRYCVTNNPRDWTTAKDAGYLGTGMVEDGANDVRVLGLYRGNLVPMNNKMAQQWQIDPDPELMSLLDTLPGIGSIWTLSWVSIANDMFYLSNLGVRTFGLSGATNNLKSGDVGLPVDVLIQERVRRIQLTPNEQPLGMYFPSSGQFWLSFNFPAPAPNPTDYENMVLYRCLPELVVGQRYCEVFVYTLNQTGQVGAWSRFLFPFAIDYFAQVGNDLLVRDGNKVYRISEEIGATDFYVDGEAPTGTPFNAMIQWPWLDMSNPGADKEMESYDLVGYGKAQVQIGYNQAQLGWFTPEFETDPDTLCGTPVPMPLTAPSLSARITYNGWNPADATTDKQRFWGFNAMNIYYQ